MISKWPVSWAEWVVIIIILIRGIGEQPKQTWNSERSLSGPRRGCHRSPLYRQVGGKMIINRKPMIMLAMILITGASPCPPTPGTKSTRSPAPRRSSVLRQLSSQGTRWLSGYGDWDWESNMRTQPADLIKTCADHNIINYMVLVEMLIMMQWCRSWAWLGRQAAIAGDISAESTIRSQHSVSWFNCTSVMF